MDKYYINRQHIYQTQFKKRKHSTLTDGLAFLGFAGILIAGVLLAGMLYK